MKSTAKQFLEIIGANTRGLVESVAGDTAFQLTVTISIIGNQSLRLAALHIGGRCRIRTHVSGSEGRKDIQTTLIARNLSDRQPLLEEVC